MNKDQFKSKLFDSITEASKPKPGGTPSYSGPSKVGKLLRLVNTYALLDFATGAGSLPKLVTGKLKDVADVATGRATFMGVGPFNPNTGFKRT